MPPAARVTDPTAHPLPPDLGPGPGSPNVFIGNLPAWRAVPAAAASAIQGAKKISDAAIKTAEANTLAAAGTPAAPAAKQREDTIKNDEAAAMAPPSPKRPEGPIFTAVQPCCRFLRMVQAW